MNLRSKNLEYFPIEEVDTNENQPIETNQCIEKLDYKQTKNQTDHIENNSKEIKSDNLQALSYKIHKLSNNSRSKIINIS